MEQNKRSLKPRRNNDMKDNIYKILFGIMSTSIVGILITIAADVADIKKTVYADRVVTGEQGRDIVNNASHIISNTSRLNNIESRITNHVIKDASHTHK